MEAIEARRSIRRYTERPLDAATAGELKALVDECNREAPLSLSLLLDEPQGFSSLMGRVNFRGVRNYLALVGDKDADLQEACGYYGEKVVLRATQLGVASCWFGSFFLGFKKDAITIGPQEKLLIVIALGHGAEEGRPHKSKPLESLYHTAGVEDAPEWFLQGVRAARLAPTARNQQKFLFVLAEGRVTAQVVGGGAFSRMDLGIVRYHFEMASGVQVST
ncbi:MAG: nitroreductase [Coriobacteriales bacterium]|jgi:nitroreductase|nr:nitroreductase [Coriobacteriales bacterium]